METIRKTSGISISETTVRYINRRKNETALDLVRDIKTLIQTYNACTTRSLLGVCRDCSPLPREATKLMKELTKLTSFYPREHHP